MAIGPGVLTADVPVGAVAAAERHTGTLALVRARSVAAVDALVNVLSPGRLDDTYTAAEPAAVAALAAAWRTAAATSASVAGDAAAAWGADPAGGLSTVPAPPPGLLPDAAGTAAQLRLTVLIEAKQRIAAGAAPEQALQHARQRAGRGAAGIGARTARTAHEHTLQAAGLGWARIPATNGCPWCLLLASRGPVYTSQRTAQGRVGPYHPWCRCRTLAVPRGTPLTGYLDPSSDVGALVDQAAAAWDATGTMDRYTTSPFARTQERARRGRTGPGRPPTAAPPTAPTGPRLSDDDQARLNTANREANRLNAQAYRLQQQGRDAEATALRGQAAIHRAEAERITDTLRGSAVREPAAIRGGGSPATRNVPVTTATDPGDGRAPAGRSLRNVLGRSGDAGVDNAVDAALKAVARVHGDGPLPGLPVDAVTRLPGSRQAEFVWLRAPGGTPSSPSRVMIVATSRIKDLSVVHEIGHYLDLFALGDPERPLRSRPAAARLMAAIRGSEDARQLREVSVGADPFSSDGELFARAYAQYVATRGGNSRLLKQLQEAQRIRTPNQWPASQFELIADAFDELFAELRWRA